MRTGSPKQQKIAIVGLSFRFPGDLGTESGFWEALRTGRDLVSTIPPERWAVSELQHPKRNEAGRSVTFSAGVLSRIDQFDAEFFGISPREAAWMDPQQRLLLELAWETMENGGIVPSTLAGSDCAVCIGISGLDYGMRSLDDLESFSAHTMTGNTLSIAANRLSYVFDLRGPSMAVDTACSSSLVALHQACNCLHLGEASVALAGGVNLLAHPYPFIGFSKASMLSAGGRCRTFDAAGDGYVRAEGGAVLLLKTLERAQADGDRIHGVILASGINADGGRKTGLTIPSSEGQIELMRTVLARAGVAPSDVDYLEAHGTGTAIGDPIETAAIGAVYGQARPAACPLPVGSVKTNLGHLEPASGMAGLIKALLVLKHREVPPSIHLETPNPKIDFAGWHLQPVTSLHPLPEPVGRQRIVGVNSFGFGGANAHILLQEHPVDVVVAGDSGDGDPPPLILSARNDAALRELAVQYAERLQGADRQSFYDIAYAAAYRRERLEKRLALHGDSPRDVAAQLAAFARGNQPAGLVVADALPESGKLAFVYAGNGAQWVGMGCLLLAESERFSELLTELDRQIGDCAGFSIIDALQAQDEAARIDDTAVAQPLLFAIQVALTLMLRERGIVPDAVTGHSVGEVAAAWAAGALSLAQAVHVICARSAAQALTRGQGRMAVISLGEERMRAWLEEGAWPLLEIAGINSPTNLTLSGPLAQLEALGSEAKARGIVFRLLDLDYAFHSRSMDAVEASLGEALAGLHAGRPAQAVFVSTVTGDVVDQALDAGYWWDNVRQPVRFQAAVLRLAELGCRLFVEISPHAILQRYLKECLADRGIDADIMPSLRRNDDGIDRVEELALRLHLLLPRDMLAACFPVVGRHLDLPAYPWQRESHAQPETVEGYRLIERRRIHPLLGWPLKDAASGWENVLDPRSQPWLADHRVGGAVVLPGAAYIEMALAAGREIHGTSLLELEELDILSPIAFDGEHGRSIRFDVNRRDGSFQICSRQRLANDEWTLNAVGRLLGAVSGYVEQEFGGPGSAAGAVGGVEHYRLAHRLGLDYGPAFRGLAQVLVDGDCLAGEIALPVDIAAGDDDWLLQPAIVDTCFQSLLDFFREAIEAGAGLPLLPVKIGRLRVLRQQPVVAFGARLRRRGLRSVLADFELRSASGETVALLSGCRFRAAALRQGKTTDPACWEIVPVVQPGVALAGSAMLPEVRLLVQDMKAWLIDEESKLQRSRYFGEAQPLFDALVTAFAYEAMAALIDSDRSAAESVLAADGAALGDEQRRLAAWARDLLVEQGCLRQHGTSWELLPSDMPSAAEIWRTLLAEYPSSMPELALIGRKGRALPDLLAGRLDPALLARELRASHQLETLHDDSLSYRGTRLAIEQLLERLATDCPGNRRLRILEIAAGLSEIPRQLGHRVGTCRLDYVLAHGDIAACDHLRHEYQGDDWVEVAEFEAATLQLKARQPLPAQYDVVIVRHLLHAAADPRGLLAWAQTRLASGGLIVIAERYRDLSAELLCGDGHMAAPQVWESELAVLDFEDVETCREPAGEASPAGGYLVLGKRAEGAQGDGTPEAARWLLLAGDDRAMTVADALRGNMVARGQVAIGVACIGELTDRNQAAALIARQQAELGGSIEQVLWIAAERAADDIELPVEGLGLVQALAGLQSVPRLSIVTTGAVPVDGLVDVGGRNPAHTALWGFGRVVMNEYPGLGCRLIDLSRHLPPAVAGELLGRELLHADGESEVILEGAARHVLRMRRCELPGTVGHAAEGQRYRLDFRVPGQLRNLLWLELPEAALAPDEVEVRPVATGLNFRDIMYVMGLLPDEAVEHGFAGASLGLEFSGVVTRVGAKVDDYVPGDAVMGFGAACFASHVVTRANALTVKPEEWSFDAAATVPTVFFTVYYALRQLANLQPGERVLIHGGAGGVGIAAIQLARHLGAEIFATAGSAEKRQFVELLGADRVFDSRSLEFADQILAATGGEGVDVVLNSLAGEAIRRNLGILRPFGRFLELGKRDFFENTPIGLRPFKDNISYFGIDADQLLVARPDLAARLFREVMALFRSGALSPLPARVFPAERVVDAFRYMQQARQIGKVVVSFDDASLRTQPLVQRQVAVRFSPDSAYLVTGGVSGFGLETARWLARGGAGQILLLGRRGPATAQAEAAVATLAALGADVRVLACDVADRVALQAVLAQPGVKPLKGIFHAAMVIDDALLANLDADRMRRVLVPKVRGAWNLHELTRQLPLDYFVLYSSVTTSIGNPGQANYVAANAWLEGLAGLRRAAALPVTCIGWGPIGDVGYLTRNQAVKDSLASRLGADPLTAETALRVLGQALVAPGGNIAIGDFQFAALSRLLPSAQGARFSLLRRHAGDVGSGTENLDDFHALIDGKSVAEVAAIVARLVTQEVAQILAISPDRIDPARSLHNLGLDSLMGVELALGLEKRFGIQVPAMMLNEGPTVERVTARIVERLASARDGEAEGDSLADAVSSVAAQHGETLSGEIMEAVMADVEYERAGG